MFCRVGKQLHRGSIVDVKPAEAIWLAAARLSQ
jgi:hypothetical protein